MTTIPITLESSTAISYDIILGKLPPMNFSTKVVVVTNPTVSSLHIKKLLKEINAPFVKVITVPDGEQYKTLQTIEAILEEMFTYKLDRKSLVIAFGGGVIGDMAGFAASIYQRGIDFIQIPTTLLSQVDASVGGKTGVNNAFGKNLIGAFYQPKAVYIDPAFLKTLPKREFAAGVAEMVKMAITFNKDFFQFLEQADLNDDEVLKEAIARSVQTKASVVNQDEKESGIRAVLNYGHTFGHVVENETNYTTYLHGEAVAIGMVMANTLAQELGLLTPQEAQRVVTFLERFDLPTHYPIRNVETFYDHFFLDKKSANDKITFILPNGIGGHVMRDDIPKDTVIKTLASFVETK